MTMQPNQPMCFHGGRGLLRGVMLATLVGGLGACDQCLPGDDDDDELIPGQLSFFTPHDGDVLTEADDKDPATPGLQVDVELQAEDIVPDGTDVTLSVDTQPGRDLVGKVSGHRVLLTATLKGGAFPNGQVNVLTVSAVPHKGSSIRVTVVEGSSSACTFLAPRANEVLTEDQDDAASGFQTQVKVACSGSTIPVAAPVRLQAFQGRQPTGNPVLSVTQALSNGVARFDAITLPEGEVTLLASALSTGGEQVGTVQIPVTVDTNRCDARIVAPPASSVLTSLNSTDLDPGTAELDMDFSVASTQCPEGSVQLMVAGRSFQGTLHSGTATVRAALPQGTFQAVARVDDGSGPRDPGESPPVSYTVDTVPPCATVTHPAERQVLRAVDDEEVPPNPSNGVTTTVRGTVDQPEGTSVVNVQVFRGQQSVAHGTAPVNAQGAFSYLVTDMTTATYRVRVWATDNNGNACPPPGKPARESTFEVSLDVPAVTVDMINDTDPADGKLIAAEDANPQEGMQAVTRVTLSKLDPSNGLGSVRFTPVRADGTATGAPDIQSAEGTLGTQGTVDISLTLPDGFFKMSALVRFTDGRPSLATTHAIQVQVDGTPPGVVIRQPANNTHLAGSVLAVVQAQVTAEDLETGSVVLSINDGASSVQAVPGQDGVFEFLEVPLVGASDGVYRLVVSARDLAGNSASSQPTVVVVDGNAPVLTLKGRDKNGDARSLSTDVASPTTLDINTDTGLAVLDYDGNRLNGLQYGFIVEMGVDDCRSLGAAPSVQLTISGLATPVSVPLVEVGALCRGIASNGTAGFTLADGVGSALGVAVDLAGNRGETSVHFNVVRAANFVRIESPSGGAHVRSSGVDVRASTNLTGTGFCQLRVNGSPVGTAVGLAPALTFGNVALTGEDGSTLELSVACTVGDVLVESLPVSVVLDDTAPTGGIITLANGVGLPPAFNRSMPREFDSPVGRYTRHLAIAVDAEGTPATCSWLGEPVLTSTPEGGAPVTNRWNATGWTLVTDVKTRCRAVFSNVDLGLAEEPGLVTALSAVVRDSAGNTLNVSPLDVLNDQVAPAIQRERPVADLLGIAHDAWPQLPGFNVVVDYSFQPDGRPASARISCVLPAQCSDTPHSVTGTHAVFGDNDSDPVTLTAGTADATARVLVVVTDSAGNTSNISTGTLDLRVDQNRPIISILEPQEGAKLTAADDADGNAANGYQVAVKVAVDSTDVDEAARVNVSVNGAAPVDLCNPAPPLRQCTGVVTVASDGAVQLVAAVADLAGNLGDSGNRTITVGATAPVAMVLGVDRVGQPVALAAEVSSGTQPRTSLDLTVPAGANLDYDQNASTGLQFGFLVQLALDRCQTLPQPPVATLEISGRSQPILVPMVENGPFCFGAVTNNNAGYTLPDGDGSVTVTLVDQVGNVGVTRAFYSVKRQGDLLRIDWPEDGARLRPGPLSVSASSDSQTSGTCQLLVNNVPQGNVASLGTSITLTGYELAGNNEDALTLRVDCTTSIETLHSLPVTVTLDSLPPANPTLVLASGANLPPHFNLSVPTDGPVDGTRFLKSLAVEVDAEGGNCGRLDGAQLHATPNGGATVDYALSNSGAARWLLVDQGGVARCRGTFSMVDFGALLEPGLNTVLDVSVSDTAGNAAVIGPASMLTDRVAPVLGTPNSPNRTLLGLANDHDGNAANGFQLLLDVPISNPDGRAATAQLTCVKGANQTDAEVQCPAGSINVAAGSTKVVIGDVTPITLADANGDASPAVSLTMVDQAGNPATLSLALELDLTRPNLTVFVNANHKGSDDASPADGFQITVTASAVGLSAGTAVKVAFDTAAFVDVCSTPAVPPGCSGTPTVPPPVDKVWQLHIKATEPSGNETPEVVRQINIDSTPPIISEVRILSDSTTNNDGKGTLVDETPANQLVEGYQTDILVLAQGVEDGQLLTLTTNSGKIVFTAPVAQGQASLVGLTLLDGIHSMVATVTDQAGNPASLTKEFLVDATAPTATILNPNPQTTTSLLANSDADGNTSTPGYLFGNTAVTGLLVGTTQADGRPCSLAVVNDATFTPVNANAAQGQVLFANVGRIPNPPGLAGSVAQVQVFCTDENGNLGQSAVMSVVVDTLAPQVASVAVVVPSAGIPAPMNEDDATHSQDGVQVRFRVTHEPLDGATLAFISDLEALDAGEIVPGAPSGSTDVRITFFNEGMHTLTVLAEDARGNHGFDVVQLDVRTGNITVNVTPKGTGSQPALLGIAADLDAAKAGLQPLITVTTGQSGTCNATLYVDDVEVASKSNVTCSGFTFDAASYPAGVMASGALHTYEVRVEGGGKVGRSGNVNVYTDVGRPVVAFTSDGALAQYNAFNDTSGQPGLQTTLKLTVLDCGVTGRPGTLVIRSSLATNPLVSVAVDRDFLDADPLLATVTLPEGAQTLTVSCTDVVGNVNEPLLTKSVAVDSVPPATSSVWNVTVVHPREAHIRLRFVAPGDDGMDGDAPTYSVAWSNNTITTLAEFDAATSVPFTADTLVVPGQNQDLEVREFKLQLAPVYFAVKARDDAGNISLSGGAQPITLLREKTVIAPSGSTVTDLFGTSLSRTAGDIDGDGVQDLIVGASGANGNLGAVHIYYGDSETALGRKTVLHPTSTGSGPQCGNSVMIVGDLNGDGYDDFLVRCLPKHNQAYLWYGGAAISDDKPADVVIKDSSYPMDGTASAIGQSAVSIDFDKNGVPDLAIAQSFSSSDSTRSPRVWVLHGIRDPSYDEQDPQPHEQKYCKIGNCTSGGQIDLSTVVSQATKIEGVPGSLFGAALRVLPTVDGDQYPELAVGAPFYDLGGVVNTGRVYVVHGRADSAGTLIPAETEVTTDRRDPIAASNLKMGYMLAVGDFDGNGMDDLAAGADSILSGSTWEGGAQVYLVSSTGNSRLATSSLVQLPSASIAQALQVTSLGDFNGDGADDLFFGLKEEQMMVMLGASSLAERKATPGNDIFSYRFTIDLDTATPSPLTVAGGTDLNGDGWIDLIAANKGGTTLVGEFHVLY